MGGAAIHGPLFVGVGTRPGGRFRRLGFLSASALLQGGALAILLLLLEGSRGAAPPARLEPIVRVQFFPRTPRAPSPPPAVGKPAPRPRAPVADARPSRMVQPREVLPELPPDVHPQEIPADASDVAGPEGAVGSGGSPEGTVGGAPTAAEGPALQQAPPPPIPARPADTASVRAGIARVLVYPPNARRNGVQGKVVVEFVLLADGRIRDLILRSGSGHAVLDAAALAAVERAAPFPPPGVDVLITVPVVFRAD